MAHVWLRFVHENGITSRAIEWFTRSEWCHVDFVLSDGRFLGARLDGGVQIRPHDYLKPAAFRYAYVEVPDSRKVYGWAISQVGKKYDWLAIAAFIPRTNWRDPSRWFCSEMTAFGFEQAHHPIIDTAASRVTPQMDYESELVIKVDGVPGQFDKGLGY